MLRIPTPGPDLPPYLRTHDRYGVCPVRASACGAMRSSPSMFSLPRRPSLGSPPTSPTPTAAGMTATTPTGSSSSSSATASPASEDDAPRRKSNNDKIMRRDLGLPPPSASTQPWRTLTRSPTADSAHRLGHPPKTRDFALSVGSPSSPLPHENCSSLRDQFLKIKERFSSDQPSSPSSSASRSLPNSIRGASPVTSPKAGAASDAVKATSSSSTLERTDSSSSVVISVPTERLLKELNDRTLQAYPNELLWLDHSHVERWYVEDNYFKGSMTCWTMERGAEVIARIARVISSQPSSPPPPPSSPTSSASAINRLNPDVSLQWIGRQLWAVTVSLPLTRNGELTCYHASIAQAIDEAIAEEVKKAPQECGPRTTTTTAAADTPPTVATYRLNPLLDAVDEPLAALTAESIEQSQPTDSETNVPSSALTDTHTEEIPADKRVAPSDSSVSTVLADEGHGVEDVEDDNTRVASSKGSTTHNEEADTVSALPLSLSMLSFTSLQSASGSGAEPGDPPALLHLHNGLDDDASHRVPPDKTGWLKKKNGLNTWQPRYFELKGNRLFYFASESEGLPRGAIVLDHAHVLRGRGDQSMTFTICASPSLTIIKFSARMTSQVYPRKSCVLRVTSDSEETLTEWITALNRASFTCHLSANSSASGSASSAAPHSSSSTGAVTSPPASATTPSTLTTSPTKKKRLPFYRLRAQSSSSSASSADDGSCAGTATSSCSSSSACLPHSALPPGTIDSAAYHHYGSVKYLQDTDPLLWEIHPHAQQKIRKRALLARTRVDYLAILSKYSSTVRQIFLPRPRPITIEQTLRDILPELFLINNVLYGGGDGNNGLENIFEVLDGCIKKFASAQSERVRCVSALLQACARTISGGDSYFVVHALLGNPYMIIRPAEARGHPIEVEVSTTTPSQFRITVFSAFSFHHIEDVENYGDAGGGAAGAGAMPEPLLRVQTYHVQEFDFANGKSTRWLRIRTDGMKEEGEGGRSSSGWMSKRTSSETGFGALLDALS